MSASVGGLTAKVPANVFAGVSGTLLGMEFEGGCPIWASSAAFSSVGRAFAACHGCWRKRWWTSFQERWWDSSSRDREECAPGLFWCCQHVTPKPSTSSQKHSDTKGEEAQTSPLRETLWGALCFSESDLNRKTSLGCRRSVLGHRDRCLANARRRTQPDTAPWLRASEARGLVPSHTNFWVRVYRYEA